MPDVGETDTAVETEEEEERVVDVYEDQPGNFTVEPQVGQVRKVDNCAQNCPYNPDR